MNDPEQKIADEALEQKREDMMVKKPNRKDCVVSWELSNGEQINLAISCMIVAYDPGTRDRAPEGGYVEDIEYRRTDGKLLTKDQIEELDADDNLNVKIFDTIDAIFSADDFE